MVLSLAFILAFVGAGVALLIGIIIFSQVQDDMLQTFGDPIQVGNGTGGIVSDSPMYICTPDDSGDDLSQIDKSGNIISTVTVPNGDGCGGLSQDPTSEIFYVAGHDAGQQTGRLSTVDVTTGIGTLMGAIAKTHSIAFDDSGDLFARGTGGSNVITKIDKTDGSTISSCTQTGLPAVHRQALAFNYDNNKMYVTTTDLIGSIVTLSVIDTSTCVHSETVTITGRVSASEEVWTMTYNTEDGLFYLTTHDENDFENALYTLETDGTATEINSQIDGFKKFRGLTSTLTVGGAPIFESQVPPEFITASNIAYTVIGIIPVALFFFLFAIFGGRLGDG